MEIRNKNITLLTWFNFCLDFRLYDAVAIVYFAKVTGSYALGFSVFSIGTIASSVFQVPTGVFSDLVGRRITLVWGAICSALSIVLYALAGSFWWLVLGSVIGGLSYALFSGNNGALIYETLKEQSRERELPQVWSKTASMFQFALGISAGLGSLVLGFETFKWVFWLSVIPQVIGVFLASAMTEPKKHYSHVGTSIISHIKESLLAIKNNYKLRLLSITQITSFGLGEAMHQFSPAFIATLWPVWAIGLARVLNHLLAATGMRLGGKFIKKWNEIKVLVWSNTPTYIVQVLVLVFPTIITPLIQAFSSFPFGLSSVAQSSLLQKEFTDKQRATIDSFNSMAGNIAFAILAFLFGLFADKVGPRMVLLVAQIASVVVLILYFRIFKFDKLSAEAA